VTQLVFGFDIIEAHAMLSTCGTYRYELYRRWNSDPEAVFIMLNPSTADACQNDPTIRKCMGFARRWRRGAIYVLNLFAARATDPRRLADFADPVGPSNRGWVAERLDKHTSYRSSELHTVVVAWGAANKHPDIVAHGQHIASLAEQLRPRLQLQCLSRSQDGSPRHPLMLPYSTALDRRRIRTLTSCTNQ